MNKEWIGVQTEIQIHTSETETEPLKAAQLAGLNITSECVLLFSSEHHSSMQCNTTLPNIYPSVCVCVCVCVCVYGSD